MRKVFIRANGQVIARNTKEAIDYLGSEEALKNALGQSVFKVILDEDGEQIGEW